MSQTWHTSVSGMLAASYGLQSASNNLANMQSPGFKRSDVCYQSLGSSQHHPRGAGVGVGGSAINFSAGKYLQGNQPTDLAIHGEGFFIVRQKNGELLYTRNGEFVFNQQGILSDRQSQGEVMGYDSLGNLVVIREKGPESCPGKATQTVWLNGVFVPVPKTDREKEEDPNPLKNNHKNIEFTLGPIFDDRGKAVNLKLVFEASRYPPGSEGLKDDGSSWELVDIQSDDAKVSLGFNKALVFSTGGFLRSGESTLHCTLNNGQTLALQFGNFTSGADKAVQLKSRDAPENAMLVSDLRIFQQDGYGLGKQIRFQLDEQGQIQHLYDNGQTLPGNHLALSQFRQKAQQLERVNGQLFRAKNVRGRILGKAGQQGAGTIQTATLESANVDSTMEFAQIVVLQRMFQACSQIMNIEKELEEGLYKR